MTRSELRAKRVAEIVAAMACGHWLLDGRSVKGRARRWRLTRRTVEAYARVALRELRHRARPL